MKKFIVALCGLALLAGLSSCKKDDPSTDEEPANTYADPAYVEGIFNPGRHIKSIVGPKMSQQWNWSGSPLQLTDVTDVVNGESYSFSYKGSGRLGVSDIRNSEGTEQYTFTYDDGTLDSYEIRKNNKMMGRGSVCYAGGHISYITYSDIAANWMIEMSNSLFGMNMSTNTSIQFDNPMFTDRYTWNGSNVATESVEMDLDGTISLSELFDLFGDQMSGAFGSYSAILRLMVQAMGDSSYAFSITASANASYKYDSKFNPFRGYWGEGLITNPRALSANNVTSVQNTGSIRFQSNITIDLPSECPAWASAFSGAWGIIHMLLNGRSIPIDQTIPLSSTKTYSYSYNSIGFPTQVTDQDNNTFTYTYQEQ